MSGDYMPQVETEGEMETCNLGHHINAFGKCPCENHPDVAEIKDLTSIANKLEPGRMQGVDCPECEDGTPHSHSKQANE
jgi:hypothetical protein